MCGRTACTLSKEQLQRRCALAAASGCDTKLQQQQQPGWRDLPCSPAYRPGYNLPPGTFLPVLYADPAGGGGRLISTMKWGLVPSWVGRDASGFSLHMSNARLETLMEKASFRNLVVKGRRCALLCEGFYEWKRPQTGPKQAYFFHPAGWEPAADETGEAESPPSLMFIAALFDVHKEQPGHPDLYSFTVVTVPASQNVSDVHDRMPAILETADQLATWLQADDVKLAKSCLKSVTSLSFYPVSARVNSTQNNDSSCLQPVKLEAPRDLRTLDKWLPSASAPTVKREAPTSEKPSPQPKRPPPPADTGLTRWLRFGAAQRAAEEPRADAAAQGSSGLTKKPRLS